MRVVGKGREENNRRVLGAFALPDERGRFEAVQIGHVHVEQNDGEIVGKQPAQCFAAGVHRHYRLVQSFQDHRQRKQLIGNIVDQQDFSLFGLIHFYTVSQDRRTDNIRSGSTGFER
jgi:hypothetical protein